MDTEVYERHRQGPRWFRLSSRIVLAVAGLLVAIRIVLPFALEALINGRLEKIPEYAGRVEDIDLSLWRGAYQLEGVEIAKTTGDTREPFFAAKRIDFSLAWRDLFHGRFVGDFLLEEGALTIVNGPTEASSQTDADRRWQDVIEDLFPIEITRLELKDSRIRFLDREAEPQVDLELKNLQAVITGLRNRPSAESGPLPARVDITGTTIGEGDVRLFGAVDLLAEQPAFKLNLELTRVDLTALNAFLLAYGNVDVSRGKFQLYLEVAAADGKYEGYIKPFFEDLEFENVADKNKNVAQRLWENVVSGVAKLVENKQRDQVATRVPFSGQFGETDVGLLAAVGNLLRHGFGQALSERLEGDIFVPEEGGPLRPDEKAKGAEDAEKERKEAERKAKDAEKAEKEAAEAERGNEKSGNGGSRTEAEAPLRPEGKP